MSLNFPPQRNDATAQALGYVNWEVQDGFVRDVASYLSGQIKKLIERNLDSVAEFQNTPAGKLLNEILSRSNQEFSFNANLAAMLIPSGLAQNYWEIFAYLFEQQQGEPEQYLCALLINMHAETVKALRDLAKNSETGEEQL